MDEPRDWGTALPDDVTTEIASRLPCRTDRRKMAAVCRAWRARAQVPPLPPALPWLLMPAAGSTHVHCFLSDCRVHHGIYAPPHGARYFGSHDGAWLFLAYDQTLNHVVHNLRDDRIRVLPNLVENDGEVVRNMVILAATLSAPPDVPLCVGACIITRWPPDAPVLRRFAFWCMGSSTAIDFVPQPEPGWPTPADLEVEDVVFHGVDFHFLTRGEHIFVYRPVLEEDGLLTLVPRLNLFEPGGRNYDGFVVHARYLVARGPELLMVVRFAHPQLMTSSFRVFRKLSQNSFLRSRTAAGSLRRRFLPTCSPSPTTAARGRGPLGRAFPACSSRHAENRRLAKLEQQFAAAARRPDRMAACVGGPSVPMVTEAELVARGRHREDEWLLLQREAEAAKKQQACTADEL
ncbi:hypothetical protein C2845_PM05G28850 [Panicum miliaceum]|uniref:KIB1-4 beta-propeller domain-containing protein n=1 Tax=Panicum miliaceum TaxID=4540 RepID=A0A3L6SUC9_PANMI|nr:hypothetical protein C2845_PM05G28850 [Panicum miliaceum]